MKHTFLLLFLFTSFTQINAQSALLEQAKEYSNAFVEREYEKMASLTHSDIVELGGGTEYIISDLQTERQMMVDKGMEYISSSVGEPGPYLDSQGELQTIVSINYNLMIDKNEIVSLSHLLAVSKNDGKSWMFVDLTKYDKESLSTFIKNLSPELEFPN